MDANPARLRSTGDAMAEQRAKHNVLFGIKTKLLLALCVLAALTAVASAVAVYGFFLIDRSVTRITAETVPTMAASLQLAEKTAEIAAIAPALMASADQYERISEQASLEEKVLELAALTQSLNIRGIPLDKVNKLVETQEQITAKLTALDTAVDTRLQIKAQREATVVDMVLAHQNFLDALEPLVDDAHFNLIISGEEVTARSTEAITHLIQGGVNTIHPLLTINAEGNLAAGLLAEVANVSDPVLIQPIREQFVAVAARIRRNLRQLADMSKPQKLQNAIDALLAFGTGRGNIFDMRKNELLASASSQNSTQVESEGMAQKTRQAHETVLAILAPLVDDATFNLVISAEDLTAESTRSINDLIDGGVNTLDALLTLRAEGNLAAGLLGEAASVRDATMLQPVRERFIAAVGHIEKMLTQLPDSLVGDALRRAPQALIDFGISDGNIFDLRRAELDQIAVAQRSLEASRALSVQLGDQVAELVKVAQRGSNEAAFHSEETIERGKLIMMLITAASVAGALLVMLYYVGPRIVRPLGDITEAMADLAAGDTSVDVPYRERSDEIGRMAQALGVFRDTAIEVQKSNLVEIRETRRRLMDAIESISEGFSLYDSQDRLVVCNSKYQQLLYPGSTEEISPGMTFEDIVRRAAERGYIKDAQNRVEEWLEERLARHREPSDEPHLQCRGDDRWILVSERKTEDGGTVAVYSEVTELKQREAELAQKSNSLEQLSTQLAKYLSPQVYDSIFRGKQEVKLVSHRKKLTVFFSDIVGFTETADRMESEDLTQLLNHYLTEMSQLALAHGATIDKYVGDAIVIFFGDPESQGIKEDALACVTMAIAMRKRMQELQDVWRASGVGKPLSCRTGINTGYCTVGNFGSEDRMDYTIIGGGVNLAARLESAASPDEILISYETYALVKDQIYCEEHGEIDVKGIAYPVVAYRVVDLYDNVRDDHHFIREHHANLKLDLNMHAMSVKERNQAVSVLRQALDSLSVFDKAQNPRKPATTTSDSVNIAHPKNTRR
jgi:class 3 adenylate cyclase